MGKKSPIWQYAGIALLFVLVLGLITVWHYTGTGINARSISAFAIAGVVLYYFHSQVFPPSRNPVQPEISQETTSDTPKMAADDSSFVKYVIAFNSGTFAIVGLAVAVSAVPQWELGLLISGSCLLIGGFLGLLFGYPQGAAQQPSAGSQTGTTGTTTSTTTTPRVSNLVAESASTLGKVLTGFTLAKAGPLQKEFYELCTTIGPSLGVTPTDTSHVVAGAVIIYFLATGFLSGILLPSYFMTGKWA